MTAILQGDCWLDCFLTHNLCHAEHHCTVCCEPAHPSGPLHPQWLQPAAADMSTSTGWSAAVNASASSPRASNLLSEQERPETQDDNDIYRKSHSSSLTLCSCKSLCNSLCLNKPFQSLLLTKLDLPSALSLPYTNHCWRRCQNLRQGPGELHHYS